MTATRSLLRLLLAVMAGLLIVVCSAPADAQSGPSLRAAALPSDVEVGRVFIFKLTAMVAASDRAPEKPELSLPPGFVLRGGPQIMPQTQVSITGAGVQQSAGIDVSWQVEARKTGRQTIGPGSVMWAGKRFTSERVQVNVHAAGTLPRRQDPFDLFDMFGFPKMPGFPDLPQMQEPAAPAPDPALAMPAPTDRIVFLRATVDKNDIVLGEQTNLLIYEYSQNAMVKQVEAHEPETSDFLQRPLLAPDDEPAIRYAQVGSDVWRVRLIRKVALFPLKTGMLPIGPLQMTYQGIGLRAPIVRRSATLRVRVHDAPEAGRPIGFRAGDVGQFSVSSEVNPTTVVQGGAVGVTVKLEGVGNLPMSLEVPRRNGVDWLDPNTREQFDVTDDDRIRGTRVFTYVVRMLQPGQIDLGSIDLPFYDPWRHAYEHATTKLGVVAVTPSAAPAVSAEVMPDRFEGIGAARSQLVPARSARKPLSDSPLFWLALVVGPSGVLLYGLASSAIRRARQRLLRWRTSLGRHSALALREARRAATGRSITDAAAGAERALHIGLEAATGLKTRGVLRDHLADELEQRGIAHSLAARAVGLLERCEALRFDDASDAAAATALLDDIEALLGELPRARAKTAGDRA